MDHPKNFTEDEWKEYLDKMNNILPFNDKEWQEYLNLLDLPFSKNPNIKFYPRYQESLRLKNAFLQRCEAYEKRHRWERCKSTLVKYVKIIFFIIVVVFLLALISTYLYYFNK